MEELTPSYLLESAALSNLDSNRSDILVLLILAPCLPTSQVPPNCHEFGVGEPDQFLPEHPWSKLEGRSVMLVEVMDSCSMEEFATRLGGSVKGLLSLALRVFRMIFEKGKPK